MLFMCIVTALCITQDVETKLSADIVAAISIIIMFACAWCLVLLSLNYKLILDERFLIHRNMLRLTRRLKYSEIIEVILYYRRGTDRPDKYKICFAKHRITVECMLLNYSEFERTLRRRMKNAGNPLGYNVPFTEKRK